MNFKFYYSLKAPPPLEPVPHFKTAERDIIPEDASGYVGSRKAHHNFLILKNNARLLTLL